MVEVARNIAELCLQEERSDVHFRVVVKLGGEMTDTKRFPAHRFVLSLSSSPVLVAMVSDEWMTRHNWEDFQVPDVDADSFQEMLTYIYKGAVPLDRMSMDQMLGLHNAAQKYEVAALLEKCSAGILENIEPENAMSVLDYCVDTVIDAQFEKRALQVVSHNAKEVFRSETFITAANKSIAAVLRLDALSISEDDVFQWAYNRAKLRCERWGKEPTPRNIRAVMGPSLHLIRFPAMPCCEFNHVVVPTHVLTDAQVVQIIVRADGIPFSRVPRKMLYKNKTRSYLSNDDFQVRKSKGKHALSNSSSGGSGSYLHPSIESSDSEAEANDDDETDGGKRTTKRRRVSAWDSDTIDFVDYDYE